MRCCDIPLREFKTLITIERSAWTTDSQGGRTVSWTAVAENIHSRMKPLTGTEAKVADRVAPRAVYSCYIRYRADEDGAPFYTPADRVICRGRYHDILHVVDYNMESKFIYMLLNEGALS